MNSSRVKFYHGRTLDMEEVLFLVVKSETGMILQRLSGLGEHTDSMYVVVPWKGLPYSGDIWELIRKVQEDVPAMIESFSQHKNTPSELTEKARSMFGLRKRGI